MHRHTPYSLQHVHCAHCAPCQTIDCLKNDILRRKCPAATRRDDLKAHTLSKHKGLTPLAVGDERPRTPKDFFARLRPNSQNDSNSISSSPTAPSTSPLSHLDTTNCGGNSLLDSAPTASISTTISPEPDYDAAGNLDDAA